MGVMGRRVLSALVARTAEGWHLFVRNDPGNGTADAFLIGERPIARRVDDSVTRVGAFGPAILRRARGYAPGAAVLYELEPGLTIEFLPMNKVV